MNELESNMNEIESYMNEIESNMNDIELKILRGNKNFGKLETNPLKFKYNSPFKKK